MCSSDLSRYRYDSELKQIVNIATRQRIIVDKIDVPDSGVRSGEVTLTAGYGNWVRDYLVQQGIDGSTRIKNYFKNLDVKLSYKVAGFTDKKLLEVIAEQSSPGGSGNNIVVPDENYKVYLHKSSPTGRLSYSAVIVERTPTGWTVSGYDSIHPYFTIIPSEVNNNAYGIEELGVRVAIYKDYQRRKLTVPYGYEFKTHQLLADFITSYARYLKSLGFVFDEINEALAVPQDWDLSIREFLTWSKQGWQEGSILVLSPAGSKIKVQTNIGVIDEITNKVIGNRLLDQNFSLIRKGDYTITRDNQEFTATTLYNKMIALADLSLVEDRKSTRLNSSH